MMEMDGWIDRLHSGFLGEHVLIAGLRLTSFGAFFTAAFVTFFICALERAITIALMRQWAPFSVPPGQRGRIKVMLWRTTLHWVSTLLQILYMLIAMSFHVGLIFVLVTTLAVGHSLLESFTLRPTATSVRRANQFDTSDYEPLLTPDATNIISLDRSPSSSSHPKPRSKPSDIYIHPAQSNLARADAVAVELGLHGSTELVSAGGTPNSKLWDSSQGREVAREILGSSRQDAYHRTSSQIQLSQAGGESEGDDNR